jgi:glycine hydroxymethyltransferase
VPPAGSKVRVSTPALTTRGFGADEMRRVAGWILRVLDHPDDEAEHARVGAEVSELAATFPVPGIV